MIGIMKIARSDSVGWPASECGAVVRNFRSWMRSDALGFLRFLGLFEATNGDNATGSGAVTKTKKTVLGCCRIYPYSGHFSKILAHGQRDFNR